MKHSPDFVGSGDCDYYSPNPSTALPQWPAAGNVPVSAAGTPEPVAGGAYSASSGGIPSSSSVQAEGSG